MLLFWALFIQKILKKVFQFPQNYLATVFNTDNRKISEGSCDTEDWSNAVNSSVSSKE